MTRLFTCGTRAVYSDSGLDGRRVEKLEMIPTLPPLLGKLVVGVEALDWPSGAHSAIVVT
ncbi:hypothetical protein H483_0113345 [Dietzia sp. UCD-THP]|nr:hypothetical protein H483_0113345 [Dietzia sp. UCD-THP]